MRKRIRTGEPQIFRKHRPVETLRGGERGCGISACSFKRAHGFFARRGHFVYRDRPVRKIKIRIGDAARRLARNRIGGGEGRRVSGLGWRLRCEQRFSRSDAQLVKEAVVIEGAAGCAKVEHIRPGDREGRGHLAPIDSSIHADTEIFSVTGDDDMIPLVVIVERRVEERVQSKHVREAEILGPKCQAPQDDCAVAHEHELREQVGGIPPSTEVK